MHDIEPFYNWRHLYIASDDENSPFYGRQYSELEFTNSIYNYALHPQWEWNDAISNDIMLLKRDVIDEMALYGINKFVVIGENVLNYHNSDDSYYEEWFEDNGDDGWIIFLNFREHVLKEFQQHNIDYYFLSGGELDDFNWRRFSPGQVFGNLQKVISKRLTQ